MDSTTIACVAVPVVLFGLIALMSYGRRKQIAATRAVYDEALNQLRQNPTDTALRQAALSAGRAYASAANNQRGATGQDELSIMNDINMITGGKG